MPYFTSVAQNPGGGVLPYMNYIVFAPVKGMVFKQFTPG